ncbi:MAG: O-antigen ligase family protein [Actinomycetota bacterium]|nr:O-antigen ligase family protein [Actinomycetota bacterium]
MAGLLLIVTALASGRSLPTSRPARVALFAFAGLVALNYLSILWAGSRGDALQSANELLLYLAVAWTFSILPWTSRSVAVLLGAFSLGIAAFCAVGLAQATSASNLTPFFVGLRYGTPLNYSNATAALGAMGMWPALVLSARREVPGWARIALLAVAVFLAEFALLPQSRGALVGLIVVAPLVWAASSDRIRLLARMGVVAAGIAVALPRTVSVDDTVRAGGHVTPVLAHAATGMLETSVAALAVGALLVLVEARVGPTADSLRSRWRTGRRTRIALVVLVAFALAGTGVAVAPAVGRFVSSELQAGRTDAPTGSTRLFSATPEERFDYVRVAARLFSSSPIVGIGGGNFGRRYDSLRRFQKHSRYAHDLPMRVASETGTVGLALFVTIIAALLVGLWRAGTELGGLSRACAVAALAVAAYFLVHDSLDWLDEFPVLAAPTLALPLAVIELRAAKARSEPASPVSRLLAQFASARPRLARSGVRAVIVALVACLCLAVGAPYLVLLYTDHALATYAAQPASAYHDLTRAAALNPLSADALTDEGAIAVDFGNESRARSAFLAALRRENDWYPHLELALLDAHAGQFKQAMAELSSAQSLDATDPALTAARALIAQHKRENPAQFNPILRGGDEAEIFATHHIK